MPFLNNKLNKKEKMPNNKHWKKIKKDFRHSIINLVKLSSLVSLMIKIIEKN